MAKILLADDSTHAQRMGAKILVAEGHEVVTVGNGQAAVNALEKAAPDLVVADIFMPGRNGYELCHFIKTDDRLKRIPVLLVIGAMEPYDPEEGKKAGADGLVTKPLESSNLLETVQKLLARFAPARPKPVPEKIRLTPEPERVKAPPEPEPHPEPEPQWEEQAADEFITTNTALERLKIPREMSQQPVGMLDELAASEPIPQTAKPADPRTPPVAAAEAPPPDPPAAARIVPEDLERSGSAAEQPAAREAGAWAAEPAPVTAEDEKLFVHAAADWGDLTKLVEQNAPAGPQVAASSSTVPPDLELDVLPADLPVPTEGQLESFETLSAVVAAPPIERPAAHTEFSAAELPSAVVSTMTVAEEAARAHAATAATPLPMEDLVRQAIDQMLPQIVDQIVERVMQSLKI